MTNLTGLSAFPITPADESGVVDSDAMRRIVHRLVEAGVDSIGLLGSTGTYAYLTREQRRLATEAAMQEAGDKVPVLVGIGALRTDEAVRLAQDAKGAGAAVGLLAPVSYTPLSNDEVYEHFVTVERESGLPLCIYDNPGTTHFSFSPGLIGRLSRLDGIVAVKTGALPKDQVVDQLKTLKTDVRHGFPVGCSVDMNAPEALLAGATTWYSVIGGALPKASLAITRAAQAGDAAETRRLHAAMEPIWELFRKHTGLRVVYVLCDLLDLCQVEPPRPILPLGDWVKKEIAAALKRVPGELIG